MNLLNGQSDSEPATVEWLDGYAKGREDAGLPAIVTARHRIDRQWTGMRVEHRITHEKGTVTGPALTSAVSDVHVAWDTPPAGIAHVADLIVVEDA